MTGATQQTDDTRQGRLKRLRVAWQEWTAALHAVVDHDDMSAENLLRFSGHIAWVGSATRVRAIAAGARPADWNDDDNEDDDEGAA